MLADAAAVAIESATWGPLANLGVTGIILWWFMVRQEKRSKATEEATDRCTTALTILLLELEHASEFAKERARELQGQVEEARKKRGE